MLKHNSQEEMDMLANSVDPRFTEKVRRMKIEFREFGDVADEIRRKRAVWLSSVLSGAYLTQVNMKFLSKFFVCIFDVLARRFRGFNKVPDADSH